MLHAQLLKAASKAGAIITTDDNRRDSFYANKGDRGFRWYTQEGFPDKAKTRVSICYWPSPHTDIQTDCFCDHFFHTIKAAIASLG